MVVSSAGLGPKSDCSGKAQKQRSESITDPVLSSERVPRIKKPTIFRQKSKSGYELQMAAGHQGAT
jgi:hypothetical protein